MKKVIKRILGIILLIIYIICKLGYKYRYTIMAIATMAILTLLMMYGFLHNTIY